MPGKKKRKEREEVARLLAKGDRTQKQVAELVGVRQETISRWMQDPEFRLQVEIFRHGTVPRTPVTPGAIGPRASRLLLSNRVEENILKRLEAGVMSLDHLTDEELIQLLFLLKKDDYDIEP